MMAVTSLWFNVNYLISCRQGDTKVEGGQIAVATIDKLHFCDMKVRKFVICISIADRYACIEVRSTKIRRKQRQYFNSLCDW